MADLPTGLGYETWAETFLSRKLREVLGDRGRDVERGLSDASDRDDDDDLAGEFKHFHD